MEVVVSVDRSEESVAAANKAAAAAERIGATLRLVHCVQQTVSNGGSSGPIQEGYDDAADRGREVVDEIRNELSEYSVEIETELLSGNPPVDAVVDYLRETRPHAVYLGHRNLTDREESMLGSFAKKLIDRSPVAVTVVSGASLEDGDGEYRR